ncbi:MAG: tRNA preQ1(34) S-adenosylmethionine ribosyltransferase-isomerase QueA [Candidatus Hydrogenedentes bacterium]|nr:tRNA preQ1(34) S-adenosylmethionine ribosyltransferase-isomerase QueA [Candidatus Hydrogenedentota bacterium]
MHISELDYELPEELIAQQPCEQRDASRLMVIDRADGVIHTDVFRNVSAYLRAGDCLVLNQTRVIRARLHGRKPSGGAVEIFLLHEESPGCWEALVRPSARVKPGVTVIVEGVLRAVVEDVLPDGKRRVRFETENVLGALEEVGEIPLPPYIHRESPDAHDLTRYQTIYAASPGAVAAPTAGLHFTDEVFTSLDALGVRRVSLTLHVGYGTFKPIQAETVEAHKLDPEDFVFPAETAATLNETRAKGGRIVAVGTTATRVLETQCVDGTFREGSGATNTFIYPPYAFRGVDVLQTNFHLPRSSLLALVYAFGGQELIRAAYRRAIEERFRFYSYGDVMLIR